MNNIICQILMKSLSQEHFLSIYFTFISTLAIERFEGLYLHNKARDFPVIT